MPDCRRIKVSEQPTHCKRVEARLDKRKPLVEFKTPKKPGDISMCLCNIIKVGILVNYFVCVDEL